MGKLESSAPPVLPRDVLEEILSHSLPRPTILSCSLANHLLRSIALKHIFRCVSVRTSPYEWRRSRELLPLLQANPTLLRYVKEVDLQLHGFQEYPNLGSVPWDENAVAAFGEILKHFGDVQSLSVGAWSVRALNWVALPVEVRRALEDLIGRRSLRRISMAFLVGVPETVLRRARSLQTLVLESCLLSTSIEADPYHEESGPLGLIPLASLAVQGHRWTSHGGKRTLFQLLSETRTAPGSFPISFQRLSDFEAVVLVESSQPIQDVFALCAKTLTSLKLQLVEDAQLDLSQLSELKTLTISLILDDSKIVPSSLSRIMHTVDVKATQLEEIRIELVLEKKGCIKRLDWNGLDCGLLAVQQGNVLKRVVVAVDYPMFYVYGDGEWEITHEKIKGFLVRCCESKAELVVLAARRRDPKYAFYLF